MTIDKDNGNARLTQVRRTRREFPDVVKKEAFKRSGGFCECDQKCGVPLITGNIRYNHRIPDWMGGEPTLDNCQVLTRNCDKPVTAKDQSNIAKAKRVHVKNIGAKRAKHPFFGWRKFDGTPVRNPRLRERRT